MNVDFFKDIGHGRYACQFQAPLFIELDILDMDKFEAAYGAESMFKKLDDSLQKAVAEINGNLQDGNLLTRYKNNAEIDQDILSVKITVEKKQAWWSVADVITRRPLLQDEQKSLLSYLVMQLKEGWGKELLDKKITLDVGTAQLIAWDDERSFFLINSKVLAINKKREKGLKKDEAR